jgi:hypothetical protein
MKTTSILIVIAFASVVACNKSTSPATPATVSAAKVPTPVLQKLQQYAGSSATDCGQLDVHATEAQSKSASDCAMQASQGKKPFYVAYDMPGMSVGVAGNSDGKLFTVQSQGNGPMAAVSAGDCPSQLRVASSGRVTCYAPGDMGSMSGSHAAGSVPSGTSNPHTQNPHAAAPAKNQ